MYILFLYIDNLVFYLLIPSIDSRDDFQWLYSHNTQVCGLLTNGGCMVKTEDVDGTLANFYWTGQNVLPRVAHQVKLKKLGGKQTTMTTSNQIIGLKNLCNCSEMY